MIKKLLAAFALTVSPAFADTVTVETYGGPADVKAMPGNIAVFDVAALDTLNALGIVPNGAVGNVYVDYLEDVTNNAVSVGSLFEPDFEAVAALGPDLIIAGGRSSKQVPALSKLAPTIDMTIWEDTIGQSLQRLEAFGAIFGKKAEAEALASEFNTKLETVREAVSGAGGALIVMTNGPKVSAYGASGRFGWLHTALGLPEAIDDVEQSTHGEAISFEFIKEANPDILIVVDRLAAIGQEGESAAATLDNALVHETAAWKNGKVVFLESAPLYIAGGGIQSMTQTLDQILALFADS